MGADKLNVVAEILERNNTVYRIPDVWLTDVLRKQCVLDEDNEVLREMLVAAMVEPSVPLTTPYVTSGALKTVCLNDTSFTLKHIITLCSSLRYGGVIETIQLQKILSKLDDADREESWCWLAFGLFVPRSKHFRSKNKRLHVDLSHNTLNPIDADAFIRTLRDPAEGLVYQGNPMGQQQKRVLDTISTCVVMSGASVFATANTRSEVLIKLGHETRLEVLCQQRDWTCVVLAGVGIAWVQADKVIDVEHEDTRGDGFRVEFTFASSHSYYDTVNLTALKTVVVHAGHCLSYLDLSDSLVGANASAFGAILAHCVNLEHLILAHTSLEAGQATRLLSALHGKLGDRLLTLNISSNTLSRDVFEKLRDFLVPTPTRIPALEELRLVGQRTMEPEQYAAMRDALAANKTLRFLDLLTPNYFHMDNERFAAASAIYKRMQANNQGELLPSALPMAQKLVFLSTIGREIEGGGRITLARCALDSFMVSTIFQFAAEDLR